MLIKWGSIVVKGSGKLGGHVFSDGPGGASVHTLARARNPQTKYQMAIRARFTLLSQGWRDLTEVQRESWYGAETEFSRKNRFGDTVLLSGKNLYNALNAQRLIIGLPIVNLAPLPTELPKLRVDNTTIELTNERILIRGLFEGGTKYMVVSSGRISEGARSFREKVRIIVIGESNTGGNYIAPPELVYSSYIEQFGEPKLGDKIFMGIYSVNSSGQRSPFSLVQATFLV